MPSLILLWKEKMVDSQNRVWNEQSKRNNRFTYWGK